MCAYKVKVKQKNGKVGTFLAHAHNEKSAISAIKRLGYKIKSIMKVG